MSEPETGALPADETREAIERGRAGGRRFARGCLLFGLPTLLGLSCIGGLITYAYLGLFADATLHVHHGAGGAAVFVDGERRASLSSPEVHTLDVERGPHQVRIEREGDPSQQWDLDLTGFDDLLVSTDPGVCFAQLDVNRVFYAPEHRVFYAPEHGSESGGGGCAFRSEDVQVFWTCTEPPCEIGASSVRIEDLPESVEGTRPVTLMVPFACVEAASLDAADALRCMVGCLPDL